jgi:hypothetical protein
MTVISWMFAPDGVLDGGGGGSGAPVFNACSTPLPALTLMMNSSWRSFQLVFGRWNTPLF